MYQYIPPNSTPVPILISIPHCGTRIPSYLGLLSQTCPDTDWFLENLYDFAPDLGIGVLHATHARYVVDLNRSPSSQPLYSDGRIITDAIPLQQFDGKELYTKPPTQREKERRIQKYFDPYHKEIQAKLQALHNQFGMALLFDAHSIKRHVPTIQSAPFPDLILGNNDQQSAHISIVSKAWHWLEQSSYDAQHNDPFKGGYITRTYGTPKEGIHALQLEMTQDLYLDEKNPQWDPQKAKPVRDFLHAFLSHLVAVVS